MSEPNACRTRPSPVVVVLSVLLAVAVVGWVTTAMSKPDPVPVAAASPDPVSERPNVLPPVPAPVETVELPVAARDIPVGTIFAAGDLDRMVTTKAVPKDALPPGFVAAAKELADKRAARTVRAGEPFSAADLTRGGVVTIPAGYSMFTTTFACPVAKSGVVGPGTIVDVTATIRIGDKPRAVTLLADTLVLCVDTIGLGDVQSFGFAVNRQQALLLELAKSRGATLALVVRERKAERRAGYNLDEVVKLLSEFPDPDAQPLGLAPLPPDARLPVAPAPRAK
jgi:pilus assembly protein CpaB